MGPGRRRSGVEARGVPATVLGGGGRRPLVALLVADLVSTLGSEMAAVALPWLVLTTTGSAARTGVVVGAEFAGVAVFGIPSGRLTARLGPRAALLLTDGICVPAALLVPVLHWAGALTFPALVIAGLAIGATFPAHQSSQRLLLATAVGDAEVALTRAGGLLGAANETASFVGPAVGGALVAVVGAPWVLVADAASFGMSFLVVALAVPPSAGRRGDGVQRTLDGIRYLMRTPVLRRRVGGLTLAGTGYTALLVSFPVLARERYGAGAALAGWLLASYGLGSVIGGLVAVRTRAVTDRGFAVALAALALTTWPLVLPSLPAWGVGVCVAGYGVASGVVHPRLFAALTASPPELLRAQVLTAATTVLAVSGPVGGVAAGLLLGGGRPPSSALLLVAAVVTAGALLAAPGRRSSPRPRSAGRRVHGVGAR